MTDKDIAGAQLPDQLSFYPGASDTEQAVIGTDATQPFKWLIATTSIDIVVETTYGTFAFYDSSTVTPGAWLPIANGKKIVASHAFPAPMGTKTTGLGTIYLYGGK